jgi:hypothetical protein
LLNQPSVITYFHSIAGRDGEYLANPPDWRCEIAKKSTLTNANINKFDGSDGETYLRKSGLLGLVKIMLVEQQGLR